MRYLPGNDASSCTSHHYTKHWLQKRFIGPCSNGQRFSRICRVFSNIIKSRSPHCGPQIHSVALGHYLLSSTALDKTLRVLLHGSLPHVQRGENRLEEGGNCRMGGKSPCQGLFSECRLSQNHRANGQFYGTRHCFCKITPTSGSQWLSSTC